MDPVFKKTSIAGIELKNRIIRSATFEAMGEVNWYSHSGHLEKDDIEKNYLR